MGIERTWVIFSLGGQRYGVALAAVKRVIRVVAVTPLPKAPPIVLGIIDLGGGVIPVINIRERFGHRPRATALSDHLIIAAAGERIVALLVEETNGVLDSSPGDYAAAGDILPGMELVQGALKRADGLVLIHDLERLLSLEEGMAIDRALKEKETW